jgi:hypothetical protein
MYHHILKFLLLSFIYYFYSLHIYIKNNLLIRNDDKILLDSICSKITSNKFEYNLSVNELTIYNNECHSFYDQYNFPRVDYDKKDIIYDDIWYESIRFGTIYYVLINLIA